MEFSANRAKPSKSRDPILVDRIAKVRWSIGQRLRKQLHQLSIGFFDEVDDFLFSSGHQGQFVDDSDYLKAMREIRAKQCLFEEAFLQATLAGIRGGGDKVACFPGNASQRNSLSKDVIYEKVEIDLALQAMARKAGRIYAPFLRQIESTNKKFRAQLQEEVIDSERLVTSTLTAFADAQSIFLLGLDIRLVFIKLFEQHFLLKMDKLFLDIVSILNHATDESFVDKLYSSSSAFRTGKSEVSDSDSGHRGRLANNRFNLAYQAAGKSDAVEKSVNTVVDNVCKQAKLPLFLERMIRTQWRAVMFLIGLNRGSVSQEWKEAARTISLLAKIVSSKLQISGSGKRSIVNEVEQGFRLIQMEKEKQSTFLTELDDYFDSIRLQIESENSREHETEARISPRGELLLDSADLDEIAILLEVDKKPQTAKQLTDYLPEIDRLTDGDKVEYRHNGISCELLVSRNKNSPDSFHLSNRSLLTNSARAKAHGKTMEEVTIIRSRLVLAMALRSGELQITAAASSFVRASKTFLKPPPQRTWF